MSMTRFKYDQLNPIGKIWVTLGSMLGLVYTRELESGEMEMNNLTNLNLTLKLVGPLSERNLTVVLLVQQVVGCVLALAIRYQASHLLY